MQSPRDLHHFTSNFVKRTPLTQEGLKIIKEIWNHSPREPDVQDYIARKGPEEKPRLLKSGWHPKCDAVYFWIFEHTSACSCGSSEGSRGFQITWKQTGSFSDDVLLTIKDSSQALVSSPLWGELWVKCLNNPDSGPQLIPYQATEKSYANMEYPFPPEWVYTLFYNYPSLTVMKFLIDRLIGLTSIKQKIFYNDGILYLWNGAFWNNFRDSCDTLSMIFNYYFGLIEKHFLAKLNLTDSTSVDSEETFWAKHFLGALRSLVQKSWGCKLPKKYLRDKYQAPAGLFDGIASLNFLIVGEEYIDLKTGKFVPPSTKYYITRPIGSPGTLFREPILYDGGFSEVIRYLTMLFHDKGDSEREGLISALQMILGYSLTGLNDHNLIVFFKGSGRNGKTTLARFLKFLLSQEFSIRRLYDKHGNLQKPETQLYKSTSLTLGVTAGMRKHLEGSRLNFGYELPDFLQKGHATSTTFIDMYPLQTMVPTPDLISRVKVIPFDMMFGDFWDWAPDFTGSTFGQTNSLPPSIQRKRYSEISATESALPYKNDDEFRDTLESEDFQTQFLQWIIQGAIKYNASQKIEWGESITEATNEFWYRSDYLKQFIQSECLVHGESDKPYDQEVSAGFLCPYSDFLKAFKKFMKNLRVKPSDMIKYEKSLVESLENSHKIFLENSDGSNPVEGGNLLGVKLRASPCATKKRKLY